MTHDRARQDVQAWFEGQLADGRRGDLRAHLASCADCRGHFNRCALALRGLRGRPDEACEDELWLFAPDLPVPTRVRWRRPALTVGALAAAAALVLLVTPPRPPPDEFMARGGPHDGGLPSLRALCTREAAGQRQVVEVAAGACRDGDRVLFSSRPRGRAALALVVVQAGQAEVLLDGPAGLLGPSAGDVDLPVATGWRPGSRAVAVFGAAPIGGATASACATGACPAGLEAVVVDLDPPATGPR